MTWQEVLPTSSFAFHTLSRLSAQTVEYFLDNKDVLNVALVSGTGIESRHAPSVEHIVQAAIRLSANVSIAKTATRNISAPDAHDSSKTTDTVAQGQTIVINLSNVQPAITISNNANNRASTYSMAHLGPEIDFAYRVAYIANTILLKIIATAGSVHSGPEGMVHRAPGPQGQLKKIYDVAGNVKYMNATESEFVGYPLSLKVMWADHNGMGRAEEALRKVMQR